MKLVAETQCCVVGTCIDDRMKPTVYRGIGLDPGTYISHHGRYDAIIPGMMGAPSPANRKMLCQVCGALSSGLHFGVFTCEGCKCFYRRSIKEGANYACAKDRNCEITMETRNSCRYCRFQKCLALGMSKEGIKLGRRPKVDSDAFQHGFYPPGDMDYHPHGYWPPMDPNHPFKTEPVFADSEDHQNRLVFGDMTGVNYAMKPEPYTTCSQQLSGFQYSQENYHGGQNQDGGQNQNGCHLPKYPHPSGFGISPDVYSAEHSHQREQLQQSWTSELSPTTSTSGSEDNWDGSPTLHNRTPSSVSLTLPEVQTGAAAAMAYANMYRGKYDAAEKVPKCKEESGIQKGHASESHKSQSTYTELVPIKGQSNAIKPQHSPVPNCIHSPSRPRTMSPNNIQMRTEDKSEVKGHHLNEVKGHHITWLESTANSRLMKRKSEHLQDEGVKARKMYVGNNHGNNEKNHGNNDSNHGNNNGNHGNLLCKSEQSRLVQELMDSFLPLEKVVSYQWQAYQQSYGEQTDQPRYKDTAHLTAFLKTHGEEVFYQIRKFAANLPGFEELSQNQKDSLLHCTAPSIITTCLLQNECGACDRDKVEKSSASSIDEGACLCAVLLLMAGKKGKSLSNDLCSKLGIILEDYINETLSRRDPDKLQWMIHQIFPQQHPGWQNTSVESKE